MYIDQQYNNCYGNENCLRRCEKKVKFNFKNISICQLGLEFITDVGIFIQINFTTLREKQLRYF